MSCIVHDNKTFNRVFWTIEAAQLGGDIIKGCFRHIYDAGDLVKRLHDWNHRAYCERYREPVTIPPYKPRAEAPKLSPVELVKLLQSINYQCVDSRAYLESGDKRDVEEAIRGLMAHIVSHLPEYEAAAWW